jgi:hypothetical protein
MDARVEILNTIAKNENKDYEKPPDDKSVDIVLYYTISELIKNKNLVSAKTMDKYRKLKKIFTRKYSDWDLTRSQFVSYILHILEDAKEKVKDNPEKEQRRYDNDVSKLMMELILLNRMNLRSASINADANKQQLKQGIEYYMGLLRLEFEDIDDSNTADDEKQSDNITCNQKASIYSPLSIQPCRNEIQNILNSDSTTPTSTTPTPTSTTPTPPSSTPISTSSTPPSTPPATPATTPTTTNSSSGNKDNQNSLYHLMKLLTLLTLNGNPKKSSTNDNALLLLLDMMMNLAKNSSSVKTTQNSNATLMILDLIKNISPNTVPKSTSSTTANHAAALLDLLKNLSPQQQQTINKQKPELLLDLLKNLSPQQQQTINKQKPELLHSILQLSRDINTGSKVVKGGNPSDYDEIYINDANYIKIRKFANEFEKYKDRIQDIKSEFNEIKDKYDVNKETAETAKTAKTAKTAETEEESTETTAKAEAEAKQKLMDENKRKNDVKETLSSLQDKCKKLDNIAENLYSNIKNTLKELKKFIDELNKSQVLPYDDDIKRLIKTLGLDLEYFSETNTNYDLYVEFTKNREIIEKTQFDINLTKTKIENEIKNDSKEISLQSQLQLMHADKSTKITNTNVSQGTPYTMYNNGLQTPMPPRDHSARTTLQFPTGGGHKEITFPRFDTLYKNITLLKTALRDFNDTSGNKNVSGTTKAIPSLYEDIWDEYVTLNRNAKTNNNLPIYADDMLYNKLKAHNLDPATVLELNFTDRVTFIVVLFFLRLIIVILIELVIDYNIIRSLEYSVIAYTLTYIIFLILLIIIVNFDAYKLRIIMNYLNMHVNSTKIFLHVILFIIFMVLVYIMIKSNETLSTFGDLFDFTHIYKQLYEISETSKTDSDNRLTQDEKLKLQYRLDIITMLVFIFTAFLVLVI